jgi:hypothetical protein
VVMSETELTAGDVAIVRDFAGGQVPVHRCSPDGTPVEREET